MERMLKNRKGGVLVTNDIVTDKNFSEVTPFPKEGGWEGWGRIDKTQERNKTDNSIFCASDATSILKMVVQNVKKLPIQKRPQSITSNLINASHKKLEKFDNISF